MEIEKLAENMGIDVEDSYEILDIYKETTTSDLQKLKEALRKGDTQKAQDRVHSIKGASANIGLDELFEQAREIEDRLKKKSPYELENLVQVFSEEFERLVQDLEKIP